jgi:thiol-disulfide isomerase/thioredoxin
VQSHGGVGVAVAARPDARIVSSRRQRASRLISGFEARVVSVSSEVRNATRRKDRMLHSLTRTSLRRFAYVLAGAITATAAFAAPPPAADEDPREPVKVRLTLNPTALNMDRLKVSRMGYVPAAMKLSAAKPASVTKEPEYAGTPQYGVFRLGNGPKSDTLVVVDVLDAGSRLYIDTNQNGDLSDDGTGEWDLTKEINGANVEFATRPVRVSWGTPIEEVETGEYRLFIYRRPDSTGFSYAKISGREGNVELGETPEADGKEYPIVLVEHTNDALFTVPVKGDLTRRMVELCVDLDGDGTFKGLMSKEGDKEFRSPERFNLADPFRIDGQWYMARPSISGAELTITPVAAPGSDVASLQKPVEVRPLLEPGMPAPAFTVETPDGKPLSLADFKGKVVILDFWATWCGPCLSSMPGLEKLYQKVKDQNVEVLSLNVYDDKDSFAEWVAANRGTKYNFTFAFDPAEKGAPESVAGQKYNVPGLPTLYLIDREGKVAAAFVGAQEEKLIEALAKVGVEVKAE